VAHASPLDGKRYKNRRDDSIPLNLTLERGAAHLLRKHAPGPRAHGKFLSELIYEFDRRQGFQDLWELARRDWRKLFREIRRDLHHENVGQK
jgi:hypothetical protein